MATRVHACNRFGHHTLTDTLIGCLWLVDEAFAGTSLRERAWLLAWSMLLQQPAGVTAYDLGAC